jgi:hypothetical protein
MSRYWYHERTQSHIQYTAGFNLCILIISFASIVTGRVDCTDYIYEKLNRRNHGSVEITYSGANSLPVAYTEALVTMSFQSQVVGNVENTPQFTHFFTSLFSHTSLKPDGYGIGDHACNKSPDTMKNQCHNQ